MNDFRKLFYTLCRVIGAENTLYLLKEYSDYYYHANLHYLFYRYCKNTVNIKKFWINNILAEPLLLYHMDKVIKYTANTVILTDVNEKFLVKNDNILVALANKKKLQHIYWLRLMIYIMISKKYDLLFLVKHNKLDYRPREIIYYLIRFLPSKWQIYVFETLLFDKRKYLKYLTAEKKIYPFTLIKYVKKTKRATMLNITDFLNAIDPGDTEFYFDDNSLYLILKPGKYFELNFVKVECNWLLSDFRKELTALIINHEICRSICNWPLYFIYDISEKSDRYFHKDLSLYGGYKNYYFREDTYNFKDIIPAEVAVYLEMPGFYLAGGILTRIIMKTSFKNRDFDIFYAGPVNGLTENLNSIRKNNLYIETVNSVSIYSGFYKIQFIKRVYSAVNHIVGGFDLDSCRLILIGNKIWGTKTAKWSIENGLNCINEKCASETFLKRIRKYDYAGFTPVYYKDENYAFRMGKISKGRTYDYNIKKHGLNNENFLDFTIYCLVNKIYDSLCIWNKKYSFEEIVKRDKTVCRKLRKRYEKHYAPLTKCRISNPTTQYTGSFFPTKVNLINHAKKPIDYDLSWDFPYVAYLALRSRFYPKLAKYILCFV